MRWVTGDVYLPGTAAYSPTGEGRFLLFHVIENFIDV
jgi:hypothetical protein